MSGAYRDDRIGGKIRSRLVPLDVLADLRWKKPSGSTRPYGGGGVGLASAFVWTDVAVPGFESTSAWERALGYQVLSGIELGRHFLVEAVFERT